MSRRVVALVVVVAGCSGPPARRAGPARVAAVKPAPVYAPPAAVAPPRSHIECHAFPPAARERGMGRKIFDFSPIVLHPVRRGPRTAERPRTSVGRTTRELREMFWSNAGDVTACWKAATSRGAANTVLEVGVTIDPFGGTHDLSVTSARASDDALVACVQRGLTGVTFVRTDTRAIRFGATLVMERSEQPPWPGPIAQAVATPSPDVRTGTVCTPVIDEGAVPQVRLKAPLVVSDWDQSREPPRRGGIPEIRLGCAAVSVPEIRKADIRTAVMSNLGALQACYADARERDPGLVGDVTMQTRYSRGGAAAHPQVTGGVGDPALHACLVAALDDTWAAVGPRDEAELEVNLTFTLAAPVSPAPARDAPAALLEAGDPEGALAAWTALLRRDVSRAAACRGRAGVVLAIAQLVPWPDDPRLRAAIADLAAAASQLPIEDARACVAEAAGVGQLAHPRPPVSALGQTYAALERYAAALPLAPYLTDGAELRWAYAEALLLTPRAAEGREILRTLTWDPTVGPRVTDELNELAERREMLSDSCAD